MFPLIVQLQDGREIVLYGGVCYVEPVEIGNERAPARLHLSNGETVVCTSHPYSMWRNDALKKA